MSMLVFVLAPMLLSPSLAVRWPRRYSLRGASRTQYGPRALLYNRPYGWASSAWLANADRPWASTAPPPLVDSDSDDVALDAVDSGLVGETSCSSSSENAAAAGTTYTGDHSPEAWAAYVRRHRCSMCHDQRVSYHWSETMVDGIGCTVRMHNSDCNEDPFTRTSRFVSACAGMMPERMVLEQVVGYPVHVCNTCADVQSIVWAGRSGGPCQPFATVAGPPLVQPSNLGGWHDTDSDTDSDADAMPSLVSD